MIHLSTRKRTQPAVGVWTLEDVWTYQESLWFLDLNQRVLGTGELGIEDCVVNRRGAGWKSWPVKDQCQRRKAETRGGFFAIPSAGRDGEPQAYGNIGIAGQAASRKGSQGLGILAFLSV